MKSAREMFEELGWVYSGELTFNKTGHWGYASIKFFKETKDFAYWSRDTYGDFGIIHLSTQELKAINKMCKQLGWIE